MSGLQFPSKAARVLDPNGTFSPFWFNWLQQIQLLISGLAGTVSTFIQNQSAGTAYMGPVSGSSAPPTFRKIVASDLPGVSVTITTAKLTGGGTNGSMTFTNGILTSHVDAT